MAIRYSEPAKPTAPLLEKAKEIRRQAEAIEAEARELLAEKRGRGRRQSGKETVTLRVDAKTVAFFKTYGDEWREAMVDALDKAALR